MRKNSVSSFIQKTWDILQDSQYSHILTWSEDGSTFIIRNEELFCSQVLPKYFKHSNFSSFIRQLNMYNFHKIKKSQNTIEFHHRLFRKNKRELLIGIKRKPSEAEIEFGEELIRKMNKESSRSEYHENSISDENTHANIQQQKKDIKNKQVTEQYENRKLFDSPLTFYLPMWMGFGMPFFEINQQQFMNCNQDLNGHKILTNIILKTPPNNTWSL